MSQSTHVVYSYQRIWKIAAVILCLSTVALLAAVIILSQQLQSRPIEIDSTSGTKGAAGSVPLCGSSNPNGNFIDLREPEKPGPFHDLTVTELNQLIKFLESHSTIRASRYETARMNSSFIYQADLFIPRKADILNYLDKSGPQPERQARVLMFRGDLSPPKVEEYICGPLPNVNGCSLLESNGRRNPVEFSVRPFCNLEFYELYETVLKEVDAKIGHILQERYQSTWTQCPIPSDCFKFAVGPIGTGIIHDINQRKMWLAAAYNVPYYSVHPVDHALLVNMNGSTSSNWYLEKVWFAGRMYNNTDDLISNYNITRAQQTPFKKPVYSENLYSTLHRRGDPVPPNPQRPPTQVEPDGKRYSVRDRKVDYMGWTFNFRMSALTGPAVFDVQFQGERIAFEISLAEIVVVYSGRAPAVQVSDYVDSGSLLGSRSKSLIPGADCPETATLVNQTFFNTGTSAPVVYHTSFCLFEFNNGYPLRRHMGYGLDDGFYGGLSDSVLILRSGLEVENYDYIIDFIFHQNGVFESRFMSTGYILSSTYTDDDRPYGFRIEDTIVGNIHEHFAHFKVDLDIAGSSNRYETLDIVPEVRQLETYPEIQYHQARFVPSLKTTEQQALFKYNFDTPKYHVVYNNASRTKYNEVRSYRIQMNGMTKTMFPENKGNEPTFSWLRHQMVVTKHKDQEFTSSSNYGMFDSANPVVNFTSFYEDNENIVDEDLVFWISAGLHHIPHTEDLPVTPTVGNHLTFFLLPYNYFPECPSMRSRDAMYIKHIDQRDPEKGVTINRYGNSRDQCFTSKTTLEEDVKTNPDQVLQSRRPS